MGDEHMTAPAIPTRLVISRRCWFGATVVGVIASTVGAVLFTYLSFTHPVGPTSTVPIWGGLFAGIGVAPAI
jgi:hypothetical protein